MRLGENKILSVIALPCFVLLYRALLCPALLSIAWHDLVACFVCVWDLWVRPAGLWECSLRMFFLVRALYVLTARSCCAFHLQCNTRFPPLTGLCLRL